MQNASSRSGAGSHRESKIGSSVLQVGRRALTIGAASSAAKADRIEEPASVEAKGSSTKETIDKSVPAGKKARSH